MSFDHVRFAAPVALLTLAAAALRFSTLDLQSFWSDEAVTAVLVSRPFGDVVSIVPETESTPPLYYVLAWAWTEVFGAGEVGLRSLSALVGTLTVPVACLVGRDLRSPRVGLAAGALVTTHPLLVWYSQEARSYALLVLATTAALGFFVRVLDGKGATAAAAWSMTCVAAMATHYFAAFVVAPMAAWLLAARRDASARIAVAAAALGGGALLPLALAQAENAGAAWIEQDPLLPRLTNTAKQFLVGTDAPYDNLAAGAVLVAYVAGALWLALRGGSVARRRVGVVASVGALALAAPLALAALGHDYVVAKNNLAALVPLLVVAAAGLAALPPRAGAAAVAGVCVVYVALVAAIASEPKYQRGDWRGAAAAAAQGSGSRLIVVAPDFGGWFARVPLRVYLPAARSLDRDDVQPQFRPLLGFAQGRPPRTVTIEEIVQVTLLGEHAPSLLPRRPAGFREVSTRSAARYAVVRYRSERPVRVALAGLVRRDPGPPKVGVLVLPP